MNRLISLVMLFAFVAQHLVCCCTGTEAHSCNHDHSAAEPVCATTHSQNEHKSHSCKHHSHACGHEHSKPLDTEDSKDENSPCDDSHQHHVCVGTHIFFVAAPRAKISQSAMQYDFGFSSFHLFDGIAKLSLATEIRQGIDLGPSLILCPQRSALCVYRI